MDKKSKEALRRYKKARQQQESSSDSSSSDSSSSSSYSSSDSGEHRHRKKKSMRHASSSDDERRKREKRELCQKKLEAKKNHIKRKLKEAKLKKRAAVAAAALSSHSYRSLSPATQAKIKKIAEREKLRVASKEHREREKHRARERERERHRESRSPSKMTKIRLHQEGKRQKSPPRMHHQLMSREKIIIQTRNRDRTPSEEREARQRHEHKLRHEELLRERERRERDRERAEREAARDKERAEALARCQERQRERERLAREKLRREEEEKKYGTTGGSGERLLPRASERDLTLTRSYTSRERSIEAVERSRHLSKRDLEIYDRDHEYMETDRRGLLEREDLRRDHREYVTSRHRELSPEPYSGRVRDPRDIYPEEERERTYKRSYIDEGRDRDSWMDPREVREREGREYPVERESEIIYTDERERLIRDRERKMAARSEWKEDWQMPRDHEWEEPGTSNRSSYTSLPKRGAHAIGPTKVPPREKRPPADQDWETTETKDIPSSTAPKSTENQRDWIEHDQRDVDPPQKSTVGARPWQMDWREGEDPNPHVRPPHMYMHHGGVRGRGGYRRGGLMEHGDRNPQPGAFRPHPPPLMTLPIHHPPGPFHGNPRFPHKRPMPPFMNMGVNIRKQQAQLAAAKAAAQASAVAAATTAVAAAKAAAQSAANATTNPSILGQVIAGKPLSLQQPPIIIQPQPVQPPVEEKPEAGEIISEKMDVEKAATPAVVTPLTSVPAAAEAEKASGELSEISDSEDDILNKVDKKPKMDTEVEEPIKEETSVASETTTEPVVAAVDSPKETVKEEIPAITTPVDSTTEKEEDVKLLDFEEISDGELEEDAKNKGVGDALGVDWASLIAETKRQAESSSPNANDHFTSAKQRWQPHHLLLNLGISMNMAGEEYTKSILLQAKLKRDEELEQMKVKPEIKVEDCPTETIPPEKESKVKIDSSEDKKPNEGEPFPSAEAVNESPLASDNVDLDHLHPIACIQTAERRRHLARQKLITNACGPNSRALSARQDLQLRRQLCGLPSRECNMPHPIPPASDKLKSLALAAFQRTLEVK